MPNEKPPRLVFINRFYRPDHSATSQLLSDLAEFLATQGAEVIVLTSRQIYSDSRAMLPAREELAGVSVRRLPSLGFGRQRLIGRALDDLSFLLGVMTWLLVRARRGNVAIAKTDPPFLPAVVAIAARLKGLRAVNWLQDLFPEVAFAVRIGVPRRLESLLLRVRDSSLRRAAVNVAIGELMADRLRRICNARAVRVVHNWAPFGAIRPVEHSANELRKQWGLEGRFVIGYSGNFGRVHEFETLLGAAASLREDSDVCFLMIGGGPQREAMMRAAAKLGLRNMLFKPYQPLEQLAASLSAADVHVVTLRPELEGLVVPSKFYGVLAAGRPAIFVGDPRGEVARLILSHRCGTNVALGDAEALAAVIRQLRATPQQLADMAASALRASTHELGRAQSLAQWQEILSGVQGQRL